MDLDKVELRSTERTLAGDTRFVLDSVIEFLADLRLSGDELAHASQLLTDLEALRAQYEEET